MMGEDASSEPDKWFKRAIAYNVDRDRIAVEMDGLRGAIEQLVIDLDVARSDGTIYTYGQIQGRLRAALS